MILRKMICCLKIGTILILFLCVFSFFGCAYTPSTKATQIVRSGNFLYISSTNIKSARRHFIRLFDIPKHKWAGKINLSDMEKPSIQKMLIDKKSLVVQINQSRYGNNRGIYSINKDNGIKLICTLKNTQKLAGMDEDFFYVIERKDLRNIAEKRSKYIFKGTRYSRKTMRPIDSHFEQNPNLIVRDAWEDDHNYWYACFHEGIPRGYVIPEGKLVLLSKSKLTGKFEAFYIESGNWKFDATILGDKYWVWIFRNPRDDRGAFIKFSKTNKTYETIKMNIRPLKPFPTQIFDEENNYLWVMSTSPSRVDWQIYRVDPKSLKATLISLPKGIRPSGAIFSDKVNLWVDVFKLRGYYVPSGNEIPYLLKITKSDLNHELVAVKPTFGDAIETVQNNFWSWLVAPFFRP